MDIAKRIRQYRIDKSLTQEQFAGYLGVTAAAVNKWEKGKSLPDITMIAPLARLMNTSTDDLLSFEKDISTKELNDFITHLSEMTINCSFDLIYKEGMDKIREYPDSEELILGTAQILYGNMSIMNAATKNYKTGIKKLYERVVNSSTCRIAQTAVKSLFYMYVRDEEYDKAAEYLDKVPENDNDYLKMKSLLKSKMGLKNESYEAVERKILLSYNDLSWALQFLAGNYLKDDNLELANKVVQVERNLAEALEMGCYMSAAAGLEVAVAQKNEKECLDLLEIMIDNIYKIDDFKDAFLFSHLGLKKKINGTKYAKVLKKGFEEDESLAFLRKNERFNSIMNKLVDKKERSEADGSKDNSKNA